MNPQQPQDPAMTPFEKLAIGVGVVGLFLLAYTQIVDARDVRKFRRTLR